MFRHIARRLLSATTAASTASASVGRPLTTSALRLDEFATPAGGKEFTDLWAKKAPSNLDVPEFPTKFLKSQSTGDSMVQGDIFPVNFYTPHGVLADGAKVSGHAS